ncbi:MAG: O-antigen ligase family protein [Candidatus Hydrogenedentes bacterium]|nr:O-antigen ligase family protein [Candidatus Hydrogenedentota bacterium]
MEPSLETKSANVFLDGARGAVVCLAIAGTACAYSVHMETFLDAKAAVLGVLLICMGLLTILRGRLPWEGVRTYSLLALFFAVATGLHIFRDDSRFHDFPYETWPQVLSVLFAIAAFDLLKEARWRKRFLAMLIFSGILVSFAAIVQVADAFPAWFPTYDGKAQPLYSVFGNSNLLGAYLAVLVPLLVWRMASGLRECGDSEEKRSGIGMWIVDAIVLLLFLLILGLTGSRGAWGAALAGTIVALGARGVTPKRAFVVGLVAPLAIFAAVYAAPDRTVERLSHSMSREDSGGNLRLWFWDGTRRMIRDHWLVGTGPGTFAYRSPYYMGEALWAPGGERLAHNELLVEDPHCEPLLILAETGAVGAIIWLVMIVIVLRCRGPEWGSLVALGAVACVSFPFRSPPHVLAALLLAGMLLARRRSTNGVGQEPGYATPSRACAALVGVISVGLGAGYVALVSPGSCLLRYAQDVHLTGAPPFDAYERALAWPLQRPTAHEHYGIALLNAGRKEEARRQFERALKGIDTGAVHLALALLAVERHDGQTAFGHFDAAIWRWPQNETAWRGILAGSVGESRETALNSARRWLDEETVQRLDRETGHQGTTRGRSTP